MGYGFPRFCGIEAGSGRVAEAETFPPHHLAPEEGNHSPKYLLDFFSLLLSLESSHSCETNKEINRSEEAMII